MLAFFLFSFSPFLLLVGIGRFRELTIVLGPAGTLGIALVIVNLSRVWWQLISTETLVAASQSCDAETALLALVFTVTLRLEGVVTLIFETRDCRVATNLGDGGARQGRQGERKSNEQMLRMHIVASVETGR
jgi:hypothetical protein